MIVVEQKWSVQDAPYLATFLHSSDIGKGFITLQDLWVFESKQYKTKQLYYCNNDMSRIALLDRVYEPDSRVFLINQRLGSMPKYQMVCSHPNDFNGAQDCVFAYIVGNGDQCQQ